MADLGTPLELVFPFKGLDESSAFSSQPPQSSRDILNMRPDDPTSGRFRGAQRSALSKFTSPSAQINGTNKIQWGGPLVYDSRRTTYSGISLNGVTGATRWSNQPPSGATPTYGVKVGRQSDVYALDGPASLVKYNKDGQKLWVCALPISDPLHVCRALALDDQDNVYVGVSGPYAIGTSVTNSDQTKARIFKVVQDLDNKTHVNDVSQGAWVIEPGGFVEDMAFLNGRLYTAQNFPDRWGSDVVVYTALGAAVPQVDWQHADGQKPPFPINAIAVKANGDYATSSEPFTGRSQGDPRFPLNSPVLIDWTPELLANWKDRVWAKFDPATLQSDQGLEEDDEVITWLDQSGNDRHLYQHASFAAPRFNRVGIAGRPSVRFAGNTTGVAAGQALQTEPNTSTQKDFADQQKTILPSYTGATDAERAMFALILVCRPIIDGTAGVATIRTLLGQSITATTSSNELFIAINRDDGNANSVVAGSVCIFDSCVAATTGGLDNRPDNAVISTASIQAAMITLLHDGGRSTTNPKSLWRLNGTAVDRWDSNPRGTVLPTEIGTYSGQPTFGKFQGDLTDIVVLRDYSGAEDGLIAHPYAPDASGSSPTGTLGDSELERIEGWAAWKNGIAHLLPGAHPFSLLKGPPRAAGIAVESKYLLLTSQNGIVAKWGAGKADLKWVVTARIAQGSFPAVRAGGIGYGIAVDQDGNFYTTGPTITAPADATIRDNSVVRKIIDNGTSATISAGTTANNSSTPSSPTGAWNKTSGDLDGGTASTWLYHYPRLATDSFSNIYIPWHQLSTIPARSVTIYDKTGAFALDGGAYSVTSPSGSDGYAVAIDPSVPDYASDFTSVSAITCPRAEFFYLGTIENPNSIHAVRFSQAATQTGSPRTVVNLAVSAGVIKRFTDATVTAPAGSGTLASPQLEAASQFVGGFIGFGKAFFFDGKQHRYYDPKTDKVLEWKSTSAGAIPDKFKLGCLWRNRAVLARGGDNPSLWAMSAAGDPFNFDQFPPVVIPTQAISGTNAQAGAPADVVNAIAAWSDDLLIMFGDHSIVQLTGDPMAGGQLDVISDNIGASFGNSWCKGPNGALYFFGSRGGVYLYSNPPIPLSDGPLPREMSELDFSLYHVQLVWNDRDFGFHVLVEPNGAGGTLVRHWFFSARTKGWFPDQFGLSGQTGVQPSFAWTVDGDEVDDRSLLFGCEDGYVRRWDRNATSDDGILIDSYVRMGPFWPNPRGRSRVKRLEICLADDQAGCRFELSASENPDTIGLPVAASALNPGQNYPGAKATANYVWLLLRNAQLSTRWAFEKGSLIAYPAGRAKERLRG